MGRTSAATKNRWNMKAYDRINLTVPKGQKATLEAAAQAAGQSVNGFIHAALLAHMGLEAWPEVEKEAEQ